MTAVLEAHAVTVQAGRKTILDAVSLAITGGETLALVGPNGAGKSTLLKVLSGELRPASGHVTLHGLPIATYAPQTLAQHRAVLSQSVTVAFPFTVGEIVAMGAGESARRKRDAMVAAALADVDLADYGGRIITTLSGGEQQRAHFARVLVQLTCGEAMHGPGILLLDEPTASLDLRHQLALIAAAQRCAARGTAVIAVLHDLNLAVMLGQRIVVMDRGRIAGDGAPRDIVTDDMLARVFQVSGAVGRAPSNAPFVLPHGIMSTNTFSAVVPAKAGTQ
ncbi:MAG: heme ABC transporter ATP-binding protein [Variibacter sp.]